MEGALAGRDRPRLEDLLDGVDGWLGLREAGALQEAAFRLGQGSPELAAVEIGSWKGRSAIALASGLLWAGAGCLHAIDPHDDVGSDGEGDSLPELRANLRRAGVEERVRVVVGRSVVAAEGFSERSVGLLFVDGGHRYEEVLADIDAWLPRLSEGAVVAFHDAIGYPGVRRALVERVLCEPSAFRRPRLVEDTLFVTRSASSEWRARLDRRRARLEIAWRLSVSRARALRGRLLRA